MAATPKRNTPTRRRSTTTTRKRKTPSTTSTTTLTPTLSAAISAVQSFLLTHDTHLLPSHLFTLHSSLSTLHSLLPSPSPSSPPSPPSPPSPWFERFVLSSITDHDPRWVSFFRMSKPTFSILTSLLMEPLSGLLPETVPVHFAVGCALFKLAHGGSFGFVGRRFGFVASDACRVFYSFCKVVCEVFGGYFGHFGTDFPDLMRNCCGVLGIEKFRVDGGGLLGKDGFLIVQGLVDSNGRFLDVSVGWPSSFSPFSILRQTRLFSGVEESKDLLNGPEIELFDGNFVPQYVLGDSSYPCLPWLITPFMKKDDGDGLSSSEIEFNEVHRKAMGLVKMAFGRVRANWKLLNKKWKEEFVQFLPFIITTSCALNNFLMEHGETLPDGDVGSGEDVEEVPIFVGEVSESGTRVRNLLALHLSKVSQDGDS